MNTDKEPPAKKSSRAYKAKSASGMEIFKTKFEAYGEEMIQKKVRSSGRSGRVYLPSEWIGKRVKIIRTD